MRQYLIFSFLILILHCASPVYIKEARLSNKSSVTKITAEDNSFVIETGKDFDIPFFATDADIISDSIRFKEDNELLPEYDYSWGLKQGGKKVKILTSTNKELYGVLLFLPLDNSAVGPVRDRYKIDIPDSYTNTALSGKQAIVYERYEVYHSPGKYNHKAWILWMLNKKL